MAKHLEEVHRNRRSIPRDKSEEVDLVPDILRLKVRFKGGSYEYKYVYIYTHTYMHIIYIDIVLCIYIHKSIAHIQSFMIRMA